MNFFFHKLKAFTKNKRFSRNGEVLKFRKKNYKYFERLLHFFVKECTYTAMRLKFTEKPAR